MATSTHTSSRRIRRGAFALVDLEQLERVLGERLDALGPAPRAELVLMLPDFDRTDCIGEFYGTVKTRSFAELLIDAEEGPVPAGGGSPAIPRSPS